MPSGLLPTPDCPSTTSDLFLAGKAPVMQDNMYQAFEINSENGKRASACTPPELIQRVVYQVYPSTAADYVRAQGIPQPPVEVDGPCGGGELAGDVAIGDEFDTSPDRSDFLDQPLMPISVENDHVQVPYFDVQCGRGYPEVLSNGGIHIQLTFQLGTDGQLVRIEGR